MNLDRANMEITHHYFDASDIVIHYVRAGAGDAVVLLHGWPQSWYCWRKIMPALAQKYTVIAPDLRGLGDSSRALEGYDKRTIAEDVWKLTREHLALDRYALV